MDCCESEHEPTISDLIPRLKAEGSIDESYGHISPVVEDLAHFDVDDDIQTPMLHIPIDDLKLLGRNNPIFKRHTNLGMPLFTLDSNSWEEASNSGDVIEIDENALDNMSSEALEQYLEAENRLEAETNQAPGATPADSVDPILVYNSNEAGEQDQLDYDNVAEIVLIHTSLGMARGQFFDSIRLRHYFDANQISYYLIDLNKDWSLGHGLLDSNLVEAWTETNLIYL